MLRRALQIVSSGRGPNYRRPVNLVLSTKWRCFSDSGSGQDGDNDQKDVDQIYMNLFGTSDDAGDSLGGRGEVSSESGSAEQYDKGGAGVGSHQGPGTTSDSPESEDGDLMEESDIPVPLFSDVFDIKEHEYHQKLSMEDIPEWSPSVVSRISKDRVQLLDDGIPNLSSITTMPLPPQTFPHPGHGASKEYATLRRRAHQEYVSQEVTKLADPKIAQILALPTWQEKQDAVDELFESVEFDLREAEPILRGHPKFGVWVEQGLESYLKVVAHKEQASLPSEEVKDAEASTEPEISKRSYPSAEEDEKAVPVFMDCYSSVDGEEQVVPSILTPLKPHHNLGPGRVVEEWELSAHQTTKRIMLRQSTREIARALEESGSARVFVTGRRGCGKTAAIASIVASARKSGHIVLYMPDGNRLHRHGYYIEPSVKHKGMFDLSILSQEVCQELLSVHEADFEGMEVEQQVMEHFFTQDQLQEIEAYSGGKISLVELLLAAQVEVAHAPMCFSAAVDHLMKQDEKPFLFALDEFNCYFEPGHYYHMDYDDDAKEAIPYDQINLFKPALDAMALSLEDDEDIPLKAPVAPKRGGVVVGISESSAIARKVTDSLSAYANRSAAGEKRVPLSIVDVPRFSDLEVDHIIANFECTGIGHLRCDQGETVLNKDGIEYLKMVSSRVGQNLIDVCCT